MSVENKKNYENEQIDTNNLDHWYGSGIIGGSIIRMILITVCIIGIIYTGYKLSDMF